MCGLFGFSKRTDTTMLMTPAMAIAMASRGEDSWGVTDGDLIYKTTGSIIESFVDCGLDTTLFHTRGASVGDICDRNAHPFEVIGPNKRVIGAHNGHITNHEALKEKYKEQRKDVEVDSEHIFYHLAYDLPLSEIGGWGAVVWFEMPIDKSEERHMYFSKFTNDALHIAKLKSGEHVFASTKQAIKTAAVLAGADIETFYTLEDKKRYCLKNGKLTVKDKELSWGKAPLGRYLPAITSSSNRSSGFNDDVCSHINCWTKISIDELLCKYHFDQMEKDFYERATV